MFDRTIALIGQDNLDKIESKHILIIGVGGVGGLVPPPGGGGHRVGAADGRLRAAGPGPAGHRGLGPPAAGQGGACGPLGPAGEEKT